MKKTIPAACVVACFFSLSLAQPKSTVAAGNAEQRTAAYMERLRSNPAQLAAFLREMPKGGDLHNHLSGAVYAESYIKWAAQDGDCIDVKAMSIVAAPANGAACDEAASRVPATKALTDGTLYNQLIDALSMRHFVPNPAQSAEDHFFNTFGKFGAVSRAHAGEMLAEVANRAALQHEQYLEITMNPERGAAEALGRQVGWDDDFDSLKRKIDAAGSAQIVDSSKKFLDEQSAILRQQHRCMPEGTSSIPQRGACGVTVRYIYEVYRLLPREQLFTQALVGFELAAADPRVVSVNPVQPEDAYASMENYDLCMRIFDYLHKQFPQVKITMHAGELAPGQVPLDALGGHIWKAVNAGAQRIGHGVDVLWEAPDPWSPAWMMTFLRERNILVEICLTSNDWILGVNGGMHPLPTYLKYGVPVALATDDEGVSRSDMTHEYLRATLDYNLKYPELKKLARNSIEYSFADDKTKAELRQRLESAFTEFEKNCCGK